MTILDLAIALRRRFVPMQDQDGAKLDADLKLNWDALVTDKNHEVYKAYKPFDKLKANIKGFSADPWVRLGTSIAYIPLVKWIADWMLPTKRRQDDDEVED